MCRCACCVAMLGGGEGDKGQRPHHTNKAMRCEGCSVGDEGNTHGLSAWYEPWLELGGVDGDVLIKVWWS